MKYIILSFDDGTKYDTKTIELLNKYGLKGTFNLNSGLDDYIWNNGIIDIKRLKLKDNVDLYQKHEVAVHTKTHPILTDLNEEKLRYEVLEDKKDLSNIFGYNVTSMAVPMDKINEEIIEIIRSCNIDFLRLPSITNDFSIPIDPLKAEMHAFYGINDLFEVFYNFLDNQLPDSLMIVGAHSYDFECKNSWDILESFFKLIVDSNVKNVTTKEFTSKFYHSHVNIELNDDRIKYSNNMVNCFNCGFVMYKGDFTCPGCGVRNFKNCYSCQMIVDINDNYCGFCGNRLITKNNDDTKDFEYVKGTIISFVSLAILILAIMFKNIDILFAISTLIGLIGFSMTLYNMRFYSDKLAIIMSSLMAFINTVFLVINYIGVI